MIHAVVQKHVFGRARFQSAFSLLHRVSLAGMNYGPACPASTGELQFLEHIASDSPSEPPIVFDVGANVGEYSQAVIERFGSGVRLFAFEPSKTAFRELQKRIGAVASVHNLGLSNESRSAVLYADRPGSGIASLFERQLEHADVSMDQKEPVVLRRLDDFCHENALKKIDLLKLDVEGNELNVLEGAGALLEKHAIRIIQFEFGGCNVDSRTFFRDFFMLLNDGYRLYRVVQDGIIPVDRYREEHEIFITVNYAAIRRVLK